VAASRRFYDDVIAAEASPRLRSWPVSDEHADVRGAWKIAEQEWRSEELRGPMSRVTSSLSDVTPLPEERDDRRGAFRWIALGADAGIRSNVC